MSGAPAIDFRLLAPEIGLAALAFLVMGVDLIWRRANARGLGWLTALGTLVVLGLVLRTPTGGGSLWQGLFVMDSFALIFKAIFAVAALLVALVSIEFAARSLRHPGEYYALLLFSTLGLMLMVSSGDLILLYLGLELSTMPVYALAAFAKDDPRSGEAGLKYIILGASASAVFLFGASLLYGGSGSTLLGEIAHEATRPGPLQPALLLGAVFVLGGFAFKLTAAPFHMWAPDVYQGAPTPIAGFLSVASKAAGFAVLLRVFLFTGANWQPQVGALLAALAFLSMIAGNLLALPQSNIKRLLAYSGVAQAGYALIAVVASTQLGAAALIFFLFQYLFTNFGAFAAVTLVGSSTGSDDIRAYNGLSRRNPLLALSLLLMLLSLGGIPPLAGFWGKLYLFLAGIDRGLYALVLVGVLASVLSLYYYLMVARAIYIEPALDRRPLPVSLPAAIALVITTGAVLALAYPGPWWDLARDAASAVLPL
jgi:NADH-quinone oxidoreductase subunit N